jgi:hypothetical protein
MIAKYKRILNSTVLITGLVMGLLLAGFAQATTNTRCQGDDAQKWNNCIATIKNNDGTTYEGDIANGQIHGYGILTLPTGEKVLGQFKNSVLTGRGLFVGNDGSRYAGDFDQNNFNGQGIYVAANGERQEGLFKAGQLTEAKKVTDAQILALLSAAPTFSSLAVLTGKTAGGETAPTAEVKNYDTGKITLPQCEGDDETKWQNCEGTLKASIAGRKYVGVFNDGVFDGGVKDKVRYIGQYKNGAIHGQGTFTYANGDKYVGNSKFGRYHGQGTYTWAYGEEYVGEWEDGFRHGQGTYTWANGKKKYVGEWKFGKQNGQGTYTYGETKYVGEWKDGKEHGQGTYTYYNGRSKYIGEYRNGRWHGQGTYTSSDGSKYVGQYRNHKKHGAGTETLANGDKIEGYWREGERFGSATFTFQGGDRIEGYWKGGEFVPK